ncbi:MAG: HEAT repeat domain-containing protein [Myxococcaceae bacterium]|nr:HEAT repeat domain-containing protein [Myxococcaceae bacterium]MCA3013455.1 HEAT repeat domain-containing protein [Myxococcaceae bacterium]
MTRAPPSRWRSDREQALLALERESSPARRAEAAEAICDAAADAPDEALPDFAPDVVRLVSDRQVEVRCAGLALAAEVLPPAEAREVLVRNMGDRAHRVRVEAVGRLADLALPEARGALAMALEDELFPVRFEAARGMVALQHPAGLETLIQALDDGELRFRAAAALAALGHTDALPALRRAFRSWFLPAFDKTQLAGALARLGDADGVAHLFKRAAKGWSMDRAMAIELLGEVKAPGAKARLLELLDEKRDPCRGAAARGLGRLGDADALSALERVLAEPGVPDDVRLDVAEGLLRLDAARARPALAAVALEGDDARAELAELLEAFSP